MPEKTKGLRAERIAERRARGKGAASAGGEAPVVLDAVDEGIIAELRKSGRIANRDLARTLGVNEATVRTRLRRLEETSMIRVVAMRDLSAMGFEYLAPVGVQVKGRSAREVGEDLAKLDRVITINVSIGAHDLEIQLVSQSLAEMEDLLTNVIAKVPGVERLIPSLALKVLKYNPEWTPL